MFCFASFSSLCAFVEAAALRSIVLRYAGAPIATRVSFFFPFLYLEMSLFSEYFLYHFRFLFVWTIEYVVRSFLPDGVFFYLVTTGWIFDISVRENYYHYMIAGLNICSKSNVKLERAEKDAGKAK